MLVRQLFDAVPAPSTLAPLPAHVDQFIFSLMDRDPARRPQSAMEALSLLSRALGTSTPLLHAAEPEHGATSGDGPHARAEAKGEVRRGRITETMALAPSSSTASADPGVGHRKRPLSTTLRGRLRKRRNAFLGLATVSALVLFAGSRLAVASGAPAVSARQAPSEPSVPAGLVPASSPTETAAAVPAGLVPASAPSPVPVVPAPSPAPRSGSVRVRPAAADLAAFIEGKRAELLTCNGDRVPREVTLTFFANGSVSARVARVRESGQGDEPAEPERDAGGPTSCARQQIATWTFDRFSGPPVTTTARLALGTKKPQLPTH